MKKILAIIGSEKTVENSITANLAKSSPVHISHVSATYKNFLDRLHVLMHTFEFIGKPFVSVLSTNGSGEEETINYINHTALLLVMIKLAH